MEQPFETPIFYSANTKLIKRQREHEDVHDQSYTTPSKRFKDHTDLNSELKSLPYTLKKTKVIL